MFWFLPIRLSRLSFSLREICDMEISEEEFLDTLWVWGCPARNEESMDVIWFGLYWNDVGFLGGLIGVCVCEGERAWG